MIELRTLGSLQLRDVRGRDLCGQLQPKQLALLAYLAHPPRRFHRRDSLLGLFWPELGSKGARNSLRQSLHSLRGTLGKGTLTTRGYEEVGVDPLLWSDVVALEAAFKAGESEHAIELYQGDLLVGFHVQNGSAEFEYWLESERVRLRNKVVRSALEVVRREEGLGNISSAVRWAQIASRFDPDNESIVQKLIDLLDQGGDRAGAIRTFEAFARRTREEYSFEPSDETLRLIKTVQDRCESPAQRRGVPDSELLEPPTTFIGRELELAALTKLLMNPAVRIVTLIGLGGSGKTRLALQIAKRLAENFERVTLVGLAHSQDPVVALATLASKLGIKDDHHSGPREALQHGLVDHELLLILDGVERVRALGPDLIGLVQTAPRLKILVTSRVPLKISGEREFVIPPLSLPEPASERDLEFPLNSEAIALFIDRAQGIRRDFQLVAKNLDAVAQICRRLDGLPLALELAAACLKTLTPQAISKRLEERFALLTCGPADRPLRHQTLEAAIGSSYELLGDDQRTLFRRLGVFPGVFSLDIIEPLFEAHGVPSIDLVGSLAALVDHSLIRQTETTGEPRFEMLDTVHTFAQRLLRRSGEEDLWRDRHAKWMAIWVEEGEQNHCTSLQSAWFSSLEREHDSIRVALHWALQRNNGPIATRLGAAMWPFWWSNGHVSEGRSWLLRILNAPGRSPRIARAKMLLGTSWIASTAGEHENAARHAKEAAALFRAAGDSSGHLRAIETFGFVRLEAGDLNDAELIFQDCLITSRKAREDRREAIALDALGQVALARGEVAKAELLFRKSVTLARRGDYPVEVGQGLTFLGDIALRSGHRERAALHYNEALAIYREAGQTINIAWTLCCIGRMLVDRGRIVTGRGYLKEALSLFDEIGYSRGIARTLIGFANVSLAQRDIELAVRLLGGIRALLERTGDQIQPDDERNFEALTESTRSQLTQPRFTALWENGHELSVADLESLVNMGPACSGADTDIPISPIDPKAVAQSSPSDLEKQGEPFQLGGFDFSARYSSPKSILSSTHIGK